MNDNIEYIALTGIKKQLINICNQSIYQSQSSIISAPYIPYIPDTWNEKKPKVLLVFEAQNLSKSSKGNNDYTEELMNLSFNDQILRLYKSSEKIGITPWDEDWLTLPLKAVFPELNKREFAVCNSVLWSIAKEYKNVNPSADLESLSKAIWSDFAKILNPDYIITVGKVASRIIRYTYKEAYDSNHVKIIETYFPYGQYPNFIKKHFEFNKVPFFEEIQIAKAELSGIDENVINTSTSMAVSLLMKIRYSNGDGSSSII
jgi:hypothetical protein